jgi:hypothetical protein
MGNNTRRRNNPTDVLVASAVSDVNEALAVGGELFAALTRVNRMQGQYDDAVDRSVRGSGLALRRRWLREATLVMAPLNERYEALLSSLDDATYDLVEAAVFGVAHVEPEPRPIAPAQGVLFGDEQLTIGA